MNSARVAIVTRWSGDIDTLAYLLAITYALNLAYLQANPDTVPLYASGVRYRREKRTADPNATLEEFVTIPELYAAGYGDCDDIAPAYAAELTARGIPARPVPVRTRIGYHVLVETPFGREDPCRALGMGSQP